MPSIALLKRSAPIPEAAVTEVEAVLTRRSVGALARERVICRDCRRTPLVGERITRYANGSIACPLCTGRRRDAVARVELVHHSEWGHAVKPLAPRAA